MSERALVARLRARVGAPPAGVLIGIGDDAAVLEPERGMLQVVTTDALVEGVHFRLDWTPPRSVGHKALAVNLSDLAAMGARPRASLLSLAIPDTWTLEAFDHLLDGFVALAEASGAALVGGNLSRSPGPLVVDVTALGSVARRRILRRSTARKGDDIYVTGWLGAAAAGLALCQAGVDRASLDEDRLACLARYETPEARTRCGSIVGRSRTATAAMDLSDGLADAASQIAEASGCGIVIEASELPIHPGARAVAAAGAMDAVRLALTGGEDYELAFTAAPRRRHRLAGAVRRCKGLSLTRVGRLVQEPGCWLERDGRKEPMASGFSHF